LQGVRPETILCLTFTKAGAAEMPGGCTSGCASWSADDAKLRKDLFPPWRGQCRRRWSRRADCSPRCWRRRAGGLRIQTIHAFAQSLLPLSAEAGLTPGFRPLEEREERQLARSTLADLLVRAESGGDLPLIRDVQYSEPAAG
jgi:ATP-dependent helicase/nuclease subunit A